MPSRSSSSVPQATVRRRKRPSSRARTYMSEKQIDAYLIARDAVRRLKRIATLTPALQGVDVFAHIQANRSSPLAGNNPLGQGRRSAVGPKDRGTSGSRT